MISSNERLNEIIDQLSTQKDTLNEESPIVPKWAHKKAKKGIESGEADYNIDK